jgi:hypothetical protein
MTASTVGTGAVQGAALVSRIKDHNQVGTTKQQIYVRIFSWALEVLDLLFSLDNTINISKRRPIAGEWTMGTYRISALLGSLLV